MQDTKAGTRKTRQERADGPLFFQENIVPLQPESLELRLTHKETSKNR